MSSWRKFRELGWSERGFLLFSAAGLMAMGLLLKLAGFRRGLTWLRRSSSAAGKREASAEILAAARRKAHLIAVAARFGPYRATCLPRSLLLWWVLRRRGLAPRLCIGVRRESGAAPGSEASAGDFGLFAHAWIEAGEEVLNDHPEVARTYPPFPAENLPTGVSWS